jgi:uncharacterized membrane protein YphA (DoxX/SURF4 family)
VHASYLERRRVFSARATSPALSLAVRPRIVEPVISLPALLALRGCETDTPTSESQRGGLSMEEHVSLRDRILDTKAPAAVLLVRLIVGAVFLSEGIQKFLFPDALGVGRFAKIGIPAPDVMAPFVGIVEISCGSLLIVGLLTRLASIPLLIDISVAIATTKVPMLMKDGFWKMAHETRVDYAMLLGLCFLIAVGSGPLSLDARVGRSRPHAPRARLRPAYTTQ